MQRLGSDYSRPRWSQPPYAPTQSTCGGHAASPLRRARQADDARPGRRSGRPRPGSDDRVKVHGRVDQERRRQRLREHPRCGHDTDLPHARARRVARPRVDDVVVQQARGGRRPIGARGRGCIGRARGCFTQGRGLPSPTGRARLGSNNGGMSTSIGTRGRGSNGRARGCFTGCSTQGRGLPSPGGNAPFNHGKRGRCGQT